MISAELRARIETLLDQGVVQLSRVAGGDINDAFRLHMADGQSVFLKTHAHAPPSLFAVEARGLEFLREANALRIPKVLGTSAAHAHDAPGFLLLEFIESKSRRTTFDEELGRGLAALHRAGAPSFGASESNFIGRLSQSNREHESWAEFYREERLLPQLRQAIAAGLAAPRLLRDFERLFARLIDLVGDPEPPARLHGDLWSGNVHTDEAGGPCLIDPAAYGGHREVDLSMMQLFGGFDERVFAAYREVFPMSAGHDERIALYQLYPLLVHLNLFGASYSGSVQRALSQYV